MLPFRFHISSAIRRAKALHHDDGVPLSLPGVRFAGKVSSADTAVWQLFFLALTEEGSQHYWTRDECCEGCAEMSHRAIRRIESLARLTRSALGRNASDASIVLLSAFLEGIGEFREYVRGFVPDELRNTPWGAGNRREYLDAMHALRAHLRNVLRQAMHLLDVPVVLPGADRTDEAWSREAYLDVDREVVTE